MKRAVKALLAVTLVAFVAGLGVAWYVNRRRSEVGESGTAGSDERTKEELYEEARRQGVEGRSKMNKEELSDAVGH